MKPKLNFNRELRIDIYLFTVQHIRHHPFIFMDRLHKEELALSESIANGVFEMTLRLKVDEN